MCSASGIAKAVAFGMELLIEKRTYVVVTAGFLSCYLNVVVGFFCRMSGAKEP